MHKPPVGTVVIHIKTSENISLAFVASDVVDDLLFASFIRVDHMKVRLTQNFPIIWQSDSGHVALQSFVRLGSYG